MADTIRYAMGQLRYTNSFSYMKNLDFKTEKTRTQVAATTDEQEDISTTEYYQDIYLSQKDDNNNFSFEVGVPYLLHLEIPKDLSYDCTYQIKMVAGPNDTTRDSNLPVINPSQLNYQMIKYIVVPRMVGIGNTSRVILYPIKKDDGSLWTDKDDSYDLKVAIAKTLNDNPNNGEVIFDESTGKYYIYDSSKSLSEFEEIRNKNDYIMEHTWATGKIVADAVTFDIIFTPRSSNIVYKGILIQMQRSELDYDIYSETEKVYGR